MSALMCVSVPADGMKPPATLLPSIRWMPVTWPAAAPSVEVAEPSNAVEFTPKTRWPPSSWAADVRSSSG